MDEQVAQTETVPAAPRGWGWRKYGMAMPLGLVAGAGALLLGLDTPIGHRLIADVLAGMETANGLRVSVARIEGSIYGRARLEGVVLRDPHGVFLRAPEGELDWRPLEWFSNGLVIHEAVVRRGLLLRVPQLRAGDPNAPLWPSFDIAINHLAVERLTVAKSVLGADRKVDLAGEFHLSGGGAKLVLDGRLGGEDRLAVLLDAHKAKNRFALKLDYNAPKGGLLAALTGTPVSRWIAVDGKGSFADWQGHAQAEQDGRPALDLRLTQASGHFGLSGKVWNDPLLGPGMRRMLGGQSLAVTGKGELKDKVLGGVLALGAANVKAGLSGAVDLGAGAYKGLTLVVQGGPSLPLSDTDHAEGLHLRATLDGDFGAAKAHYTARTTRLVLAKTRLEGFAVEGTAERKGKRWNAPVKLATSQILSEDGTFDSELKPVQASGIVRIENGHMDSDSVSLTIPHGVAKATMRIDLAKGTYDFDGNAVIKGFPTSLGAADLQGPVEVRIVRRGPWRVLVNAQGVVPRPTAGMQHLAGGPLKFSGHVEVGKDHYFALTGGKASAPDIDFTFAGGRADDGRLAFKGEGRQERYGLFAGQLSLGKGAPRGSFHLRDPMPALGMRDVDIDLEPEGDDLRVEVAGQSALGGFEGALGLTLPKEGASRLTVRGLTLSDTFVTGALDLAEGGAKGTLSVGGGGVSGSVALAPRAGGQGVEANLAARNARFEGEKPLTIALGQLKASGLIQKHHTTLSADLTAQGIGKNRLFIGRLAAAVRLSDGSGRISASIGGRRGSAFDMQGTADVAPDRIAVIAGGHYAGQTIAMPRRALLSAETRGDGSTSGWRLAPSQIDFGGGRVVAQGLIGNGSLELGLGLSDMPLSLGDVVFADLGLGGKASGQLSYIQKREALPTGEARLMVKGLTRSGLVLMSRPVDVAVVARLGTGALDLRAVASDGGAPRGRLQARIDNLAPQGALADRLLAGRLAGQLRYAGPADALWRLMALEALDLTGPVEIAADMDGSLGDPRIRGSLAGSGLRLQSAASGMDITDITAKGSFGGSRLSLTELSGRAAAGTVSGSGGIDFSRMEAGRGPSIDIALAARKAQLLARPDMAITVSGPLRILSDGRSGTVAGRVEIDKARWKLGQAAANIELPNLPVREINRRADLAPATERQMPWKLMIDASGGGIRVQGLGMDSSWNADIRLRGAMLEPAVSGAANLVEGTYDFGAKHFDLTRGRITFDGSSPPDPRLDIAANASISGLTAAITVRGTSNKPEITFSSTPALPEEELLSRILFGDSITQISAPEAIQLGAALAALHGGGGLDPINKLRSVVGLDRLRFVAPDTALGRQQAVAVGKYLHRHIYVELVTDGRGYSATNLEFRLTSWLALLGSVGSNDRRSINARLQKDY